MTTQGRTKEKLKQMFLINKPYLLSYRYKSPSSGFKQDEKVLRQMIDEGLIKEVRKDSKEIVFQWISEINSPEGPELLI